MTSEPTDIIETLEKIRQKNHPDIPSEVVREIVEAEYETLENRNQSRKMISNIIEGSLKEGE